MPLDDAEKVGILLSQGSDEWKRAALIENVNAWIDEQRTMTSKQMGLKV
jgi:hypothetical protein